MRPAPDGHVPIQRRAEHVTGVAESLAEEPDRTAELLAAGLPALVVHGQRDRRLWSPDVYADLAGRLGADRVMIDRASHSANMEQPGPTAAALLEVLGHPDPAGASGGDRMSVLDRRSSAPRSRRPCGSSCG